MAVHWFAWVCFALAGLSFCGVFYAAGAHNEARSGTTQKQAASNLFGACLIAMFVLGVSGYVSGQIADDQNSGLASRNTKYFKAQGYHVLSAYGHKVCVAAGPHKLCLQERKDATGTKQLVVPLATGKVFVVHGPASGFMDALSHAPSD